MPQIISALPSMETDGEQIMNTLKFMTGMKFNLEDHQWQVDKDNDGPNLEMIERYLSSLTANDLMAMKTNTFHAIGAALAKSRGEKAYDAEGNFAPSDEVFTAMRNYLDDKTIDSTQNAITLGAGSGMKNKLIEKLGFKTPKTE